MHLLLAQTHNDAASTAAGGVAVFFVMIVWLILIIIATALYLLPLIIAVVRKRPNIAAVAVIDILLGWSFIGWIVALVLALMNEQAPQQITIVNQQGQNPTTVMPAQPAAPPPSATAQGTSALDSGYSPPTTTD